MFKKISLIFLLYAFFSVQSLSETLKEIKVNGNDRVSTSTIINFTNLKLDSIIMEDDLNDTLKLLYETNFFEDINFSFKDGLLIIDVIEHPIIQEIKIEGVKAKNLINELKDSISLKDKSPLVKINITNDVNTILNIFKQSGHYFVKVNPLIEKNSNNTVNLIFEIDKGDKATIDQINFIGNKIFKSSKLLSVITSEEDRFWKFISNKKFINLERIRLDKRLLLNFYREKGYYNVEIRDAYTKIFNDKNFVLTFNIDAGKKYYFGNFELNLPNDFDEKKFSNLYKTFKALKSERYNFNLIENILDEIEQISLIQNYEFIDANITENVVDDKINFIIDIVETPKKFVKRIDIFGNNITSEEFIRDNFQIDEGDPFNQILFNKSLNNLRSKGLFKSVNSKIVDDKNEFQILEINIEEKPTGEITAAAGYGTNGSTVSVGIKENNFKGKGIRLSTALSLSEESVKGSFEFTHPNFAYSDRELSTALESTSTDKLSEYGYESNLNAISIGTRYEQFNNLFFSPRVSIMSEEINVTSSASDAYKKQEGSYFDANLSYGLEYDLRNSRYQPTDGYISSWYQTLPFLSDDQALFNSYQLTKYSELVDNMVLSSGFMIKTVNSLSDKDVRVSKRLYIPSSRLRGFEAGKVGPKDGNDYVGGNYVSTLNFSSTIPYLFQTVEELDVKLFFDAGNVWGVDYSSSLDDKNKIRSSTGIAMELLTPVGPLSFSFAQVLSKASSDKTETFRFQLGTTF